jgi:hypothetical protein
MPQDPNTGFYYTDTGAFSEMPTTTNQYQTLGGGGLVQGQPFGGAPAPYTVNAGQAIGNYMAGFTPEMMNNMLGMEAQYGPQYRQLTMGNLYNTMRGGQGYQGTVDLTSNAAREMAGTNEELVNRQNIFNQNQLYQSGAGAVDAYLKANPWMQSAMSRSDALGGAGQNVGFNAMQQQLLGGAPAAQNITPQAVQVGQLQSGGMLTPQQVSAQQINAQQINAERIASGQVSAGDIAGGSLGQSLYQQALNAQQMSPLSQALQGKAMGMVNSSQLTPDEIRAATQGAREGYAGTGRLEDSAAITGEALARAGASRQRMMENLQSAQGINAQLLGASQMGQQLATDVLKTDIARQQANVGNQLNAGQFNVSSALQAAQANQQTGLQASQANQDASLRASLANQQASLQASLANQQAGMQAGQFNITNQQGVGQYNLGMQAQLGQFNTQMGQSAAEANRAFNNAQQQQYLGNLQNLGLLGMQQREADRAYNLQQVGAYGNVTNAALGASGFGQPSAAMGYGQNALQAGMGYSTAPNYTVFDPNAGVNLALANASNLNQYQSNVYGANQALAGANAQASAAKTAGMTSAIGGVLGAGIGAAGLIVF